MKHNGRTVLKTTGILKAARKRKNVVIEARIGWACKAGRCYMCYKNKCTCPCHTTERKMMVNP